MKTHSYARDTEDPRLHVFLDAQARDAWVSRSTGRSPVDGETGGHAEDAGQPLVMHMLEGPKGPRTQREA